MDSAGRSGAPLGTASVSVDICAAPDRVWALITDITLMPRFSGELQRVEWVGTDRAPGLGAQFTGVNRHPAIGEWTTTSIIIDCDPPRLFGWAVGDPENPAATWRFELSSTSVGSRLQYTALIGPGPSGVTMLIGRKPNRAAEIVERRLVQLTENMAATLAGMKALAETN